MDELTLSQEILEAFEDGNGEIIFIFHEPDYPDLMTWSVDDSTRKKIKDAGIRDQLCLELGRENQMRFDNDVIPNCGLFMGITEGTVNATWLSLEDALERREQKHEAQL